MANCGSRRGAAPLSDRPPLGGDVGAADRGGSSAVAAERRQQRFPPRPTATAIIRRHRRAPPSVLPDISPSRGEIDLGRASRDAAGVGLRCGRWAAERRRHPPISPLEGEMSAQPTEGGLRRWRQNAGSNVFRHGRPPPPSSAATAAHPPLSCRTSPPQGGRSTWGRRLGMRGAPRESRPGAGVLRCGGRVSAWGWGFRSPGPACAPARARRGR